MLSIHLRLGLPSEVTQGKKQTQWYNSENFQLLYQFSKSFPNSHILFILNLKSHLAYA
jgi:hypothetical protein